VNIIRTRKTKAHLKDKRVIVQLSTKMLHEFNKACEKRDITKSDVVRSCITRFIKKDKKNDKDF